MTYGIPYTVRGWGDEIVTTVEVIDDVPARGDYVYVVRATGTDGPVILVPTVALTPVDTTPPEPEPGAWLIDGMLAVRFRNGIDEPHHWVYGNRGCGYDTTDRWASVWGDLGSPGIIPRRFLPAPVPIEMPYALYDVTVEERQNGVWLAIDQEGTYCSPEAAESHGWALISAARAAREATP